jgi:hypothetical protein
LSIVARRGWRGRKEQQQKDSDEVHLYLFRLMKFADAN